MIIAQGGRFAGWSLYVKDGAARYVHNFFDAEHYYVGGEAKLTGTADYMAPEIIRGDDSPTRAADYYSLGCVLFELIEGRPPFAGTAYEKFQAHLNEPIRFGQDVLLTYEREL